MSKTSKILLGLATIWPLVYIFLFAAFFLVMMLYLASDISHKATEWNGPPVAILFLIPLHLLTCLWVLALLVFYIINLFQNQRVKNEIKPLWAVVLFLGNIVAMPIYWYLYIWKDPQINNPPDSGTSTAQ